MQYLIILVMLLSLLTGCNYLDDPLNGKYANDPEISFNKIFAYYNSAINDTVYYSRIIHNYNKEEKLLVIAGEYNRSDGKPSPASGKDLFFTIKSAHGDEEVLSLDTPQPNWMDSMDNITLYLRYIYPKLSSNPQNSNGIVEIYNISDTLTLYYRSYWHNHLVIDRIFYNP
jgi:hypothetical protein